MKIRNILYGYQFENGVIIRHPEESQTVRQIFSDYLQGHSLLQIAETLNSKQVAYMPGFTGWNKARIKRLIDDKRYLGNETYPAIIQQDIFDQAQKLKEKRNTQTKVDRTADIYKIVPLAVCGECGQAMRRIHNTRCIVAENWVCKGCKNTIKLADTQVVQAVTECLNALIDNPGLADKPTAKAEPPLAIYQIQNEIGWMLDSPSFDKEKLKNKLFECASLKYSELDTDAYLTERIKAVFENTQPLTAYDRELLRRTVTAVIFYADSQIGLTLKNGRQIRKEQHHAASVSNAAETGTRHSAHHQTGEYCEQRIYPQTSGGILPRIDAAGGTA